MPRVKIPKKNKKDIIDFYTEISNESGVDLLKTKTIIFAIIKELGDLIIKGIDIKIKGFLKIGSKKNLPRYTIDARSNKQYLSKGSTRVTTLMDQDLTKKLHELVGNNGKKQD